MSNLLVTLANDTEPLVLGSDSKTRDDFTIASGTFLKGEVVYANGAAIAKYVAASNVPNAVLLHDQDASSPLTGVSALIRGDLDARKVVFSAGDADTANAIYGPTISSKQALALVGVYLVDCVSIDGI